MNVAVQNTIIIVLGYSPFQMEIGIVVSLLRENTKPCSEPCCHFLTKRRLSENKKKDKCRDGCIVEQSDGLDLMVAALPPQYTSRFGEVVWAQGGPGFGWWPSYIYDPSMTVEKNVRSLAQKNLGKRHLVYFFQCIEAPFDVLLDVKITEWYDGLAENYHLGKAARSAGKNRTLQFEEALKIAVLEMGKPLDQRMDWNHPDPPLSPQQKKKKIPNRKKRRASKPLIEGAEIPQEPKIKLPRVGSVRTNLLATLEQHHLTCALEVDDYLYVRVLRDRGKDKEADNVGFVQLQSQTNSTFAHARQAILNDLEPSCLPKGEWKFYIPSLGPMSTKQETSLGPMLKFLQDSSTDPTLGNGSCRTPVKALICEI